MTRCAGILLLGLLLSGSISAQGGDCCVKTKCSPRANPTPTYDTQQPAGCWARSFGHDSVVCVCNATHCDLPGPSPDPTPDHYTVITSTRSGLRFHTTTPHLVDSPTPGGVLLKVATLSPQQTMIGFGSSFTDAATITTHNLSPATQDHLIRSYFGPEGLEYDLVRVPIAGTDFSTRPYTYLDDHHQNLDDFTLSTEDIEHKLPLLRRALELSERPLRVLASPWSPPAWMKTNDKLTNGGQLLPDMWHQWALYLVRFLQEYEAAGVNVWGITTQNHPFSEHEEINWNSCSWTPENMRDWLKSHLGPALKEAGLQHLQVLVGDDTRKNIHVFRDIVLGDEEASEYIDGVAVHWYHDFATDDNPPRVLDRMHLLYPDKFILYTEACIVSVIWESQPGLDEVVSTATVALGSWGRAELYAINIIQISNHHVTGWIDWNFALDTEGGPNWAEGQVDAPIIIDAEKDEFYKQPMYFAMGHFSKYVPGGSVAVPSWIESDPTTTTTTAGDTTIIEKDIHTTAFIHPYCHLVVVILNTGEDEHVVNYMTDFGKFVSVKVSPRSIQTLLVAREEREHTPNHKYSIFWSGPNYPKQSQGDWVADLHTDPVPSVPSVMKSMAE
ncbi:hypothetical protein Pmani_011764 [Petrolisthes manimaculis]|uniref:Glucosylceramidase n=1 Tax=Petrolisthes manimaculis TaxID=1843537 RepID=A0AAE1PYL0_9EUCA|nr:hypothetical protein Pmani_011764 [Petrolisthes manimaculis]